MTWRGNEGMKLKISKIVTFDLKITCPNDKFRKYFSINMIKSYYESS
jgi:hypothetical protein